LPNLYLSPYKPNSIRTIVIYFTCTNVVPQHIASGYVFFQAIYDDNIVDAFFGLLQDFEGFGRFNID